MGTWGAGPFANDSADELLDTLEAVAEQPIGATELADLLSRGVMNGQDADPSEIVAAATLVVANLRREGSEGMGCPRVEGWLDASAADEPHGTCAAGDTRVPTRRRLVLELVDER